MALIVGGILLLSLLGWWLITYNRLIGLRNSVNKSWSDIDILLKQRHDELPQLVKVCQSHMEYEREVLDRVIRARGAAANSSPGEPLYGAQNQVSQAVRSLLAVAESYPNLKADQSLLNLQQRITSLENLIADRREFYNACVTLYNTGIQVAPDVLVAERMGLGRRPLWRVPQGQDLRYPTE